MSGWVWSVLAAFIMLMLTGLPATGQSSAEPQVAGSGKPAEQSGAVIANAGATGVLPGTAAQPVKGAEVQPGTHLLAPAAVQLGGDAELLLSVEGLSNRIIAVTMPTAVGLRVAAPAPPVSGTLVQTVPASGRLTVSIHWVPQLQGDIDVAVDLWVAPPGTAIAGSTLPGNAKIDWQYVGRYTSGVWVYPKDVLRIGWDTRHNGFAQSVPASLTEALRASAVLVADLPQAWSSAALSGWNALWVNCSGDTDVNSAFTSAEAAAAAAFVQQGGSLLITCAPAGNTPARVNQLLSAVGATLRVSDQISERAPGGAAGTGPVSAVPAITLPETDQNLLRQLTLPQAIPLVMPRQGATALLRAAAPSGDALVYAALERVGAGWVAVLGTPLLTGAANDENMAFATALAGWLAEQGSSRKN